MTTTRDVFTEIMQREGCDFKTAVEIVERRAKMKNGDRPRKKPAMPLAARIEQIREMVKDGNNAKEIATKTGLSLGTVYFYISKAGVGTPVSGENRRDEILKFINAFFAHHYRPPSIREIAAGAGCSGTSGAVFHLERLVEDGRLHRAGGGTARSYTPVWAVEAIKERATKEGLL